MTVIVNGIEITVTEIICPDCGCTEPVFRYLQSNRSIQMRCADCDKFIKNVKYDSRPKEQIRKDEITKWANTGTLRQR